MTGGYGSAIGGTIGAVIEIAFIGIAYAQWNTDWTWLFLGLILFVAVLTNSLIRRRFKGSKMTETSSHEPAALALENVERFGSVIAVGCLDERAKNQVTCVLGDNGAGKSTLIKILSGVHTPSDGQMYVNGEPTTFSSPREALDMGIATVFQDLATVPLMAVWRNFYLGNEPTWGFWPFRGLRTKYAKESCKAN